MDWEGEPTPAGQALTYRASTDRGISAADVGLLVLRLLIGIIFLGHGLQKLGWFEAPGYPTSIEEQQQALQFFGYTPSALLAWLLTLTEAGAGISLILGALTPFGAAGVIGIAFQFVAGLQWSGGLYGSETSAGFEFSLPLLTAGLALALIGPGRISVDRALGWRLEGFRWGLAGIALGLLVGTVVLMAWGPGFGASPPTPPAGP